MLPMASKSHDHNILVRFLLVRHGESQVMVDGVVGGLETCSGLSEKGRLQAGLLRDRFATMTEPSIDVVYSSPLPRAKETTDIALSGLHLQLAVEIHPELEEFRLGQADGLTWEKVQEQYPDINPANSDPYETLIPGGDSRAGFRHRVSTTLSEIAKKHPGKTVFIGCHGGVISAAMASAFGLANNQTTLEIAPTVTSITELELVAGDGKPRRWVCHRYNDSAHLRGSEVDPLKR
jgi:probable phosphoglycerate mutase